MDTFSITQVNPLHIHIFHLCIWVTFGLVGRLDDEQYALCVYSARRQGFSVEKLITDPRHLRSPGLHRMPILAMKMQCIEAHMQNLGMEFDSEKAPYSWWTNGVNYSLQYVHTTVPSLTSCMLHFSTDNEDVYVKICSGGFAVCERFEGRGVDHNAMWIWIESALEEFMPSGVC